VSTMAVYYADRIDGRPRLWVLTPATNPPLDEVTRVLHAIRLLSEGDADATRRKEEILAAKTDLVERLEHAETIVREQALPLPAGADWTTGTDSALAVATTILERELPGAPPSAARNLASTLTRLPTEGWQLDAKDVRAALFPPPPQRPRRPAPPAR
jgi:hypothetical protein